MTERATLRRYQPRDLAALYEICQRTGHNGADASSLYPDPRLLGSVFAAPYAQLEPELVFVIDDGQRAVGYILGTADTASYVDRFRREWLPTVARRYPESVGEPGTAEEGVRALLHHPERLIHPELGGYPAHLHIDLLPSHQHGGHGRALMTRFLATLAARGVTGVHLAMGADNINAGAFYRRLGFTQVTVAGSDISGIVFLVRDTSPPD